MTNNGKSNGKGNGRGNQTWTHMEICRDSGMYSSEELSKSCWGYLSEVHYTKHVLCI